MRKVGGFMFDCPGINLRAIKGKYLCLSGGNEEGFLHWECLAFIANIFLWSDGHQCRGCANIWGQNGQKLGSCMQYDVIRKTLELIIPFAKLNFERWNDIAVLASVNLLSMWTYTIWKIYHLSLFSCQQYFPVVVFMNESYFSRTFLRYCLLCCTRWFLLLSPTAANET